MIKHFCDICGRKIEPGSARLSTTIEKNGVKLELDVISSVSGDICRYCILDALAALDDRPTELASFLSVAQTGAPVSEVVGSSPTTPANQ